MRGNQLFKLVDVGFFFFFQVQRMKKNISIAGVLIIKVYPFYLGKFM